jgi:hypothetical protein
MSGQGSNISSIADPALLNKIDKLFASGVEEYVFLPQIIIVDNQSSGKSSILEALTGLFFLRDSGLCIRFICFILVCYWW